MKLLLLLAALFSLAYGELISTVEYVFLPGIIPLPPRGFICKIKIKKARVGEN